MQAGKRISEVEIDGKLRIAAIRRLGSVSIAAPGDVLTEGDEINAIVAPDALTQFAAAFRLGATRSSVTA